MIAQPENRLLSVFECTADLDPDERAHFLERACSGEPALRRRLDAMLAADNRSTRSILAAQRPPHPPAIIIDCGDAIDCGDTGELDPDSDTIHAPPPSAWLRGPADLHRTAEFIPAPPSRTASARPRTAPPTPPRITPAIQPRTALLPGRGTQGKGPAGSLEDQPRTSTGRTEGIGRCSGGPVTRPRLRGKRQRNLRKRNETLWQEPKKPSRTSIRN